MGFRPLYPDSLKACGAQVPRLHAILVRKQVSAVPVLSPDLATVAAQLPALRATALKLLAEAAGGDRLVAEYLLLQLVSRHVLTAQCLVSF